MDGNGILTRDQTVRTRGYAGHPLHWRVPGVPGVPGWRAGGLGWIGPGRMCSMRNPGPSRACCLQYYTSSRREGTRMVCRSILSLAGAVARHLNHLALSEYVILAGARIPTAGDPGERHPLAQCPRRRGRHKFGRLGLAHVSQALCATLGNPRHTILETFACRLVVRSVLRTDSGRFHCRVLHNIGKAGEMPHATCNQG
jgi:hypothetical protein